MPTIREITIDDLPQDMREWFHDMVTERARIGYKDHPHVIEGILSVVWEVAYIPGRAREGGVEGRGHNNDEQGNGIEQEERVVDMVGMRADSEDDVIGTQDAKYIIMLQDATNSLSLPASYKAWLNRMITERFESGYNISDHVVEGMQWAVSEACYVAGEYPEDSDAGDELVTDEASGAGHALVAAEDNDEVMGSDEEGQVDEAGDNEGSEVDEEEEENIAPTEGIDAPAMFALQQTIITNRPSTIMGYVDENLPATFDHANEAPRGRPAYADGIDRAILYRWITGETVEMDLGYRPAGL
ncbi:hypothetical protein OE88DRAFT_1726126 [Heliocybe sulcata]|uniref:Uncharacterized protein n=1 Tax=Heliocybe sulcata TaxID=5364 RepID=A0A5C3MZX4_9AGAM|nr:hypothetical protein OE88DRAFT_1726126 [Heliocybe sulcata]